MTRAGLTAANTDRGQNKLSVNVPTQFEGIYGFREDFMGIL